MRSRVSCLHPAEAQVLEAGRRVAVGVQRHARLRCVGARRWRSRIAEDRAAAPARAARHVHRAATHEARLAQQPVRAVVAVLVRADQLDMNTPPYQAEALRWGLPNSTHLVVQNAGHEQTFYPSETSPPVIRDFLAGQDVHDRKITYPPLRFVPLEGKDDGHPSVR